jgi:hypothetical protein
MQIKLRDILFFLVFTILCCPSNAKAQALQSRTYYLSPSGDDRANGKSPLSAWHTLDRINQQQFNPGDSILLEGGKTFAGFITLDSLDSGSTGKPVVISSFGKGMALIEAGNGNGIYGYNCSFISISKIQVKGRGVDENKGSGIFFYSNRQDIQCRQIRIHQCIAEGFNQYGILIGCAEGEDIKGFDQVRITHCTARHNGEAGIGSYGGQTKFHHTNFYVGDCKVYENKGIPTKTENHSGNGIVMGGVENLLIEHCEAFENGALNRCTGGGPVGIWVWLCKKAVIQYCESHHNHAGLTKDGGGFDIDGGSSDCVIQYNYSHDNEGAGYLLAEYGAILPFVNDTIRFNISQNDGRKNGYGAITIWGVDKNYRVRNSAIYNNTIFVSGERLVKGIPAGVYLMGTNLETVVIANNIISTSGGAALIKADENVDSNAVRFISNNYYSHNNNTVFNWASRSYHSLESWRSDAEGQEIFRGKLLGTSLDPQFLGAGSGKTIGNTRLIANQLNAYLLHKSSPMRHSGIDLRLLNIFRGKYDFYGRRIDNSWPPFTGASAY